MNKFLDKTSSQLLKIILPLTAFLVPLFFLPYTADFFAPNKQILLGLLASIALLSWALKSLAQRQIKLTITSSTTFLFLLVIIFILSSLLQTPNTTQALLGRTSLITSLFIILLTTTSEQDKELIPTTLNFIIASISIASLFTIIQYLELGQATSISWLQSQNFNPIGGPLSLLTILLPVLPFTIYRAFKKEGFHQILLFLSSSLMIVSAIMAISLVIPQNNQQFLAILPPTAGWNIAVEVLKNIRTTLLGTGPETFSSAFSRFKPLSINQTPFWNIRFNNSSNHFFHLITTIGILGSAFYLISILKPLIKSLKGNSSTSHRTDLIILLSLTLLSQLLTPINITLLTLTFIILSLMIIDSKNTSSSRQLSLSFSSGQDSQNDIILPWILLSTSLLLIGFYGYFKTRAYAADITYTSSIKALQNNQGAQAYNLQIRSLQLKPYDANYHIAYSQTNLALANSIASQSQEGQLTEQQRANITQLIQQSINEAKVATQLEPSNPATWANLANIYRQLINLAQDAEQWAVAAYTQAIRLDPLNPQLRVSLGGLHYSLQNYEEAIELFKQATNAKPDWANAYYNLAVAYRDDQQPQKALRNLRIVGELLEPTSEDYQTVQDQITQLEKIIENETPTSTPESQQTDEIQAPTPIPSPTIEPIQLPDESGLEIPQEATSEGETQTSPTPTQ